MTAIIRIILGAFALAGLGASAIATYAAFSINSRRRRDLIDDYFITPFELKVPHQDIQFRSADGYNLKGWLFENPDSDRLLIGLTGRRVAKDSLIGIGTGLWRAGNNVLVFDFRGRGESDDGPQSIGHREMADVRAALAYAKRNYPEHRLGLFGFSMGASLAIRAAAEDPEILAVMADSPFTSIDEILTGIFRRKRLPATLLVALARRVNQLLFGYDFAADSTRQAIARIAPRPLLLIHGSADSTTPAAMAEELYKLASEPRELWLEPDVEHCGVYFVDRERYIKRVADFFAGALFV